MSRIHSRKGWTLNVSRECIDVTQFGSPWNLHHVVGQVECTLDLDIPDVGTTQKLMERLMVDYDRGCPSVEALRWDSYRITGIKVTLDEANAIARDHVHPLDVLLPKAGTVVAVPLDMTEFR